MKLEICNYPIDDAIWSDRTALEGKTLHLNKEDVEALILKDPLVKSVELELVAPGESARVVNILDLFDARCKSGEEGCVYPGFAKENDLCGIGKTNVIRGFMIAEVGKVENLQAFTDIFLGVLDASGPGAEKSVYKDNFILAMILEIDTQDAETMALAHKRAALALSEHIAGTTLGQEEEYVETYDDSVKQSAEALPAIGYIYYTESQNHLKETYFYGTHSHYFLPFVMHPNEVMDGAMICMMYEYSAGHRNHTYSMVNNPVVRLLYEKHDKELVFGGMIVCNAHLKHDLKKSVALLAAKMAKHNLKLDGVVITKEGGGHPVTDLMLCCEACEKLGLKTALITEEVLNPDGTGMSTVFYSELADLVISTGNHEEMVELPPVDRVVGAGSDGSENHRLKREAMTVRSGVVPGLLQIAGHTRIGCEDY